MNYKNDTQVKALQRPIQHVSPTKHLEGSEGIPLGSSIWRPCRDTHRSYKDVSIGLL